MFTQQIYFLPLASILIILFLMSVITVNLYIKTRKQPYMTSTILFIIALIPFIYVSFTSIKVSSSVTTLTVSWLLISLVLSQAAIYHLFRQKNKKELLFFLITSVLICLFGLIPKLLISIVSFLLIVVYAIFSYFHLKRDIPNSAYLLSLFFTLLVGATGAIAFSLGNVMFAFLFSSFLMIVFITQFLLLFERIFDLMQAASYSSITDSLTGLFNRRYFTKQVEQKGREGDIGIIFCDIDNFKRLNDTNGHAAGDDVLVQVANIAREVISGKGIAGRYGGEEIVILVEEFEQTPSLAELIRERVENESIVTLSIGYSTTEEGHLPKEVIDAADQFMYKAKNSGKNRVIGSMQ